MLRLDAAENAFFLRELENIESEMHRISYPEMKYDKLVPTETGFDPGAMVVTYRELDQVGKAKVISDKSKRLPRVDVYGREVSAPVKPIGDSFGYSIYEIKAAAKAGRALSTERAAAARETVFRLLEEIAAKGDSETGLKGLCNHSSVGSTTAPNGAGASPLWSSKTAAEILTDLNLIVSTIRGNTLGVEAPDTILMDEAHYTKIAQMRADSNTDKTVLEFFLSSNPFVNAILPWHFLSTLGAGATSRLFGYRRDPSKLKLRNPHGYEQLPPEAKGLEFEVSCHMSTAGVIYYKPLSAYALDGI